MSKIIIVIDGGLVQAVYSNDENVSVDVLDKDNWRDDFCSDDESKMYEKMDHETEDMEQIY